MGILPLKLVICGMSGLPVMFGQQSGCLMSGVCLEKASRHLQGTIRAAFVLHVVLSVTPIDS